MILGFTGTRHGMTPEQRAQFAAFLANHMIAEFHHGGCVGADLEAAALMPSNVRIVEHPGQPGTYLRRNREIVVACDRLVGVSGSPVPLDKGGTWYTINYARKMNVPVHVIWPDGRVTGGDAP